MDWYVKQSAVGLPCDDVVNWCLVRGTARNDVKRARCLFWGVENNINVDKPAITCTPQQCGSVVVAGPGGLSRMPLLFDGAYI